MSQSDSQSRDYCEWCGTWVCANCNRPRARQARYSQAPAQCAACKSQRGTFIATYHVIKHDRVLERLHDQSRRLHNQSPAQGELWVAPLDLDAPLLPVEQSLQVPEAPARRFTADQLMLLAIAVSQYPAPPSAEVEALLDDMSFELGRTDAENTLVIHN